MKYIVHSICSWFIETVLVKQYFLLSDFVLTSFHCTSKYIIQKLKPYGIVKLLNEGHFGNYISSADLFYAAAKQLIIIVN